MGLEQVRTSAKGEAATRQFAALLPKLAPAARVGLIRALADRGDPGARPALLALLASDRDESVRVATIEALGKLGGPSELPMLLKLLATGSQAEQIAARKSLERLPGQEVGPMIAQQMKSAPSTQQIALIEILTARRAMDTMPDLLAAAIGDDPAVRSAAMKALGKLAGPEQLPGMLQGVLKAEEGRERVTAEKCVMFVCNRIEDEQQRTAALLSAVGTLSAQDRLAILPTLGRVGGPAALKIVEGAVADPREEVHDIGLRALCSWPDASVADRLIELLQTDQHPDHRRMALRALIRVAPLPDGRTDAEKLQLLERAMTYCRDDADRNFVLRRAAAVRLIETLRFLVPYLDQPAYAQQACQSIVELAHHRELRQPHKAEFDQALDRVIQISHDATVVERANRYKKDQTWVRPKQKSSKKR